MHQLPKMIVQKEKKKPHNVLDKENNSKIWHVQILWPKTKTFCLHCYHCFPSTRSIQERNFGCVIFKQKEKKKTFFSLARVPTFVAALVTCTGCWGLLHRVGSGSVCCTILVKLIAGRWKEAAGEPKRHEGRTRLWGGKESVKNVLLCTAQSPWFTFVL